MIRRLRMFLLATLLALAVGIALPVLLAIVLNRSYGVPCEWPRAVRPYLPACRGVAP